MGKVYLLPSGTGRRVPGLGEPEQGPDAEDPDMTVDVWRDRLRRHPGELKSLLPNQAVVAGGGGGEGGRGKMGGPGPPPPGGLPRGGRAVPSLWLADQPGLRSRRGHVVVSRLSALTVIAFPQGIRSTCPTTSRVLVPSPLGSRSAGPEGP